MAKIKSPSRKPPEDELNITSMMDMFTIILVFLLKSYSTQDISIAGDGDLVLPASTSNKEPELAVNVVVTSSQIVVDGFPVVQLDEMDDEENPGQTLIVVPDEEKKGQLISALFDKLGEKADYSKHLGETSGNAEHEFKGRILLQCHNELPFSVIREVMYTAGQAQFGEFKFVVYKKDGG
jgi:biopolymer transport protein ExbD